MKLTRKLPLGIRNSIGALRLETIHGSYYALYTYGLVTCTRQDQRFRIVNRRRPPPPFEIQCNTSGAEA
jgi:hypothetical protein